MTSLRISSSSLPQLDSNGLACIRNTVCIWRQNLVDFFMGIGYCIFCLVFSHFYSASHIMSLSEVIPTTAIETASGFTRRTLQATVIEGLAQGPYVAARTGFELTTLRWKDVDSTNAQPCPTI